MGTGAALGGELGAIPLFHISTGDTVGPVARGAGVLGMAPQKRQGREAREGGQWLRVLAGERQGAGSTRWAGQIVSYLTHVQVYSSLRERDIDNRDLRKAAPGNVLALVRVSFIP